MSSAVEYVGQFAGAAGDNAMMVVANRLEAKLTAIGAFVKPVKTSLIADGATSYSITIPSNIEITEDLLGKISRKLISALNENKTWVMIGLGLRRAVERCYLSEHKLVRITHSWNVMESASVLTFEILAKKDTEIDLEVKVSAYTE